MIKSIRIKNFKAIKDTGELKLNPMTCFIGYNGSGKSSILEALLTFKELAVDGLDIAMQRWKGFENIQYKGSDRKKITHRSLLDKKETFVFNQSISFKIKTKLSDKEKIENKSYTAETEITKFIHDESIVFLKERLRMLGDKSYSFQRDFEGRLF